MCIAVDVESNGHAVLLGTFGSFVVVDATEVSANVAVFVRNDDQSSVFRVSL